MAISESRRKQSADNIKKIRQVAIGCGWLSSAEISEKLNSELTPNRIGMIISYAIKLNKFYCNVYCKYENDRKVYFFTSNDLPFSKSAKRLQGADHMVDEKKILCELMAGKDWFFSHEIMHVLGVSNKKLAGLLRSLKEFGFHGYIISQKTIQLRWVHRCWKIEKDEPVKFEQSLLSKRWV